MDGKHDETALGRNARWLEYLMREILELTYRGQPISIELAEITLRCIETIRDQLDRLGA